MVKQEDSPRQIEKKYPEEKLEEKTVKDFFHADRKCKGTPKMDNLKFVYLSGYRKNLRTIEENIAWLKAQLPQKVKLIAVSKTQPVEMMLRAYQCGQRVFGENKAREMEEKHHQLPADIEWHFIGHLQSNKVKYIAPFVHLIQAVDREELLPVINREAVKNKRIIPCLLQFHIATEETKYGMNWEEAAHLLESKTLEQYDHVRIIGVMGMASFTEDTALIRREFSTLYHYYLLMKNNYFRDNPDFMEISMGMSGDYPLAIEEGSTMIRVGTLLFGERNLR